MKPTPTIQELIYPSIHQWLPTHSVAGGDSTTREEREGGQQALQGLIWRYISTPSLGFILRKDTCPQSRVVAHSSHQGPRSTRSRALKLTGLVRVWMPFIRGLFHPKAGAVPHLSSASSITQVNDLLGHLSGINKNVLKFNFKKLASIIYIDYFSSSRRPVWEPPTSQGTGKEAREVVGSFVARVGAGRGRRQWECSPCPFLSCF